MYCRCERQAIRRLLGPEDTGHTSGRQRHDDLYSDRCRAARRPQTHTSCRRRQFDKHVDQPHHYVMGGRGPQFHKHVDQPHYYVVDRRRQRRRQGRVFSARPIPRTLPRFQRHRHATAPHSWCVISYLSGCLAVNLFFSFSLLSPFTFFDA